MSKFPKALQTSLLPQYQGSAAFTERFLVAAHVEGATIDRSVKSGKLNLIDASELNSDVLTYFYENKDLFRAEFESELASRVSSEELRVFFEVVSTEWFDGKSARVSGRPRQLKRSVHDYFQAIIDVSFSTDSLVQVQDLPLDVAPLISIASIAAILTVNNQMIYRHIEEWKSEHPNHDALSSGDIFLRRGLSLPRLLDTAMPYREWDFINSYSIAFSAPEKFTQNQPGQIPAIVNGELALFDDRILFFSPFIPNMDVGQLEFGIIPSLKPLPIHHQGEHSGINEYIIDPAPYQKTCA